VFARTRQEGPSPETTHVRQAGDIQVGGSLVEGSSVLLTVLVRNYGTEPSPSLHPYVQGQTPLGQIWVSENPQPFAKVVQPGETVAFQVEYVLPPGSAGTWTTIGIFLWNDSIDAFIGQLDANGFTQMTNFEVEEAESPNLILSQVQPVQVVFDSVDVDQDGTPDFVLNKPMAFRVEFSVERPDLVTDDMLPITVQVSVDGVVLSRQIFSQDELARLLELSPPRVYLSGYTPAEAREETLAASIVTSGAAVETDDLDNNYPRAPKDQAAFEAKETSDLSLYFRPVHELDPNVFRLSVERNEEFLRATYPVAAIQTYVEPEPFFFVRDSGTDVGLAVPLCDATAETRQACDLIWFYLGSKIQHGNISRFVGLATREFLSEYGQANPPKGISIASPWPQPGPFIDPVDFVYDHIPAVFVNADIWTGAAHEIGHTYGIPEGYDLGAVPSCENVFPEGSGYWVELADESQRERNGPDFMGCVNNG